MRTMLILPTTWLAVAVPVYWKVMVAPPEPKAELSKMNVPDAVVSPPVELVTDVAERKFGAMILALVGTMIGVMVKELLAGSVAVMV